MSTLSTSRRPRAGAWTRAQKGALAALVVLGLAGLTWTTHGAFDSVPDACLYRITAHSIATGEGYSYLGAPFVVRPPGTSFLFSIPLRLGWTSFFAMNLSGGLMGVGCVALLFIAFRRHLGAAGGFAVGLSILLNPMFQRLCNQTLSDVPGATLMLACIAADRWARRGSGPGRNVLVGALIGIATLVRSMNVLLIPALIASRCARGFEGGPRGFVRHLLRLSPLLLVPIAIQAPWWIRNARVEIPRPTEQVYLHSYGTAMWHTDPGDPDSPRITAGDFLGRVPDRLAAMVPLIGARMREGSKGAVWTTIGGLALVLWILAAARRRGSLDFLALFVLVTLATYFAFKDRLILPLYLLVFPTLVGGLVAIVARFIGGRLARVAVPVLVVALAVFDAGSHPPHERLEASHETLVELAELLDERFPGDTPLAAPHGWTLGVLLERPVYSLQIIVTREQGGVARVMELIEENGVTAVVTNDLSTIGRRFLDLFEREFTREAQVGSFHVFRVPR